MIADFFLTLNLSGKEKCQIFQKVSSFPDCTAAGKKKKVTDYMTGFSIHELVLKKVMALVHTR